MPPKLSADAAFDKAVEQLDAAVKNIADPNRFESHMRLAAAYLQIASAMKAAPSA